MQADERLSAFRPCRWGQYYKNEKCHDCIFGEFTLFPQSANCYKCSKYKSFKKEPVGSQQRYAWDHFCTRNAFIDEIEDEVVKSEDECNLECQIVLICFGTFIVLLLCTMVGLTCYYTCFDHSDDDDHYYVYALASADFKGKRSARKVKLPKVLQAIK